MTDCRLVRNARWLALAAAALALVAAPALAGDRQTRPPFKGLPLTRALTELRETGLKIIFSSDLVRPAMIVLDEPRATDPRAILDEILAPHGLHAISGSAKTLLIVKRSPRPNPNAAARVPQRQKGTSTAPAPPAYREAIVVRSTDAASARSRPETIALIDRRRLQVSTSADGDPVTPPCAHRASGIHRARVACTCEAPPSATRTSCSTASSCTTRII